MDECNPLPSAAGELFFFAATVAGCPYCTPPLLLLVDAPEVALA